jgi:hypothetical protein
MSATGVGSREPRETPALVCDFCGAPRARDDRHRFVWDSGLGVELVLADLCGRCAAEAGRLLKVYGGHGREAIRFEQAEGVAATEAGPTRGVGGLLGRSLLYLLIALSAFVVVTLITSRG